MGRPADWQPLAGSDPVPGDAAGISAEAARLGSVAQLIASQVGILRQIAAGQSQEKGKHVAKLQAAASDTAGQLAKVIGRYQETAAALTAWVPELEYAQALSLKALAQAQDAVSRQRASRPIQRPPGTQLTAADKQQNQARANALAQANSDLAAARALLGQAVSLRDQRGGETASRISRAISGDKDSFWSDLGGFFSSAGDWLSNHWVPLLKDICEGLEIVATILAIACLFIPGVDLVAALLLIAFGATVLAAIGRGVLAATGNGSWLEFGLDIVAAATLGFGSFAASPALERAADGAVEAAGEANVTNYFGSTVGRLIGEGRAQELGLQWAREDVTNLAWDGGKAGVFSRAWSAIKAGGNWADWQPASKIAAVISRYGAGSPQVASAVANGSRALAALRVTGGTAGVLGLGGVIGSGGEMVDMQGQDVFRVTIPGISDLWDRGVHATTGTFPGWHVTTGGGGG